MRLIYLAKYLGSNLILQDHIDYFIVENFFIAWKNEERLQDLNTENSQSFIPFLYFLFENSSYCQTYSALKILKKIFF